MNDAFLEFIFSYLLRYVIYRRPSYLLTQYAFSDRASVGSAWGAYSASQAP